MRLRDDDAYRWQSVITVCWSTMAAGIAAIHWGVFLVPNYS